MWSGRDVETLVGYATSMVLFSARTSDLFLLFLRVHPGVLQEATALSSVLRELRLLGTSPQTPRLMTATNPTILILLSY